MLILMWMFGWKTMAGFSVCEATKVFWRCIFKTLVFLPVISNWITCFIQAFNFPIASSMKTRRWMCRYGVVQVRFFFLKVLWLAEKMTCNSSLFLTKTAPPGMYKTSMGYLPYQLVQDFFHQQYVALGACFEICLKFHLTWKIIWQAHVDVDVIQNNMVLQSKKKSVCLHPVKPLGVYRQLLELSHAIAQIDDSKTLFLAG